METESKMLSELKTKETDFVYAASKSVQTFKPDSIFDNLAGEMSEEESDDSSDSEEEEMTVEYRKEGITAMAPIKV